MSASTLSRKTLDDLARRHVAFLQERLTSDQARDDWVEGLRDAYSRILTVRIGDVLDPAAVAAGISKALTTESVRDHFAPIARRLNQSAFDSLKQGRTLLGDYVPEEARREIDALLERPDLVPDALVRKVFEQQVVVDAIDDTLYDGLLQFNTTVNPFFADWGLPSVIKRVPIGGSLILASMEAIRTEFERRLEPEIRKFVAVFSRRAIGEMTEAFLARSQDPKLVELRRNVVAFLYSQSLSDLLAGVDTTTAGHAGRAIEIVAVDLVETDRLANGLRDALERIVEKHGDATFGQWLEEVGAAGRPDVEAWAELLWPQVRLAMRSDLVRGYLERITAEFYDSLEG